MIEKNGKELKKIPTSIIVNQRQSYNPYIIMLQHIGRTFKKSLRIKMEELGTIKKGHVGLPTGCGKSGWLKAAGYIKTI